jgi:hypothetical protein
MGKCPFLKVVCTRELVVLLLCRLWTQKIRIEKLIAKPLINGKE